MSLGRTAGGDNCISERHRALRESWSGREGEDQGGTEELRPALRKYRDLTEQLLNA
ncbi:hypothetical protein [Streptomyces sp. GC420]|uniref:hypothetical protein n=1 Tax=Streptomyces sp. GC420 TaxID=2697568 RepID=UPI0014152412|nr:hypothetical protein [Streptomyces sp. GC420]NBM20693.1 hypothetical protein [Streptomyces sp. GC420]